MIHRLALVLGGAGAAGVLAIAVALSGAVAPAPGQADALVPLANDLLVGDHVSDAPAATAEPPSGAAAPGPKAESGKQRRKVDVVYVLPTPRAPVVHQGKPTTTDTQPTETPRPARDHNGGGQAGDEPTDDQAGGDSGADDQAEQGSDDQSANEDSNHDGSNDDNESGDD